jgi:hypothetical protein
MSESPPPYRSEEGIAADVSGGDDELGDSSDPELEIEVDVASGSVSMMNDE